MLFHVNCYIIFLSLLMIMHVTKWPKIGYSNIFFIVKNEIVGLFNTSTESVHIKSIATRVSKVLLKPL